MKILTGTLGPPSPSVSLSQFHQWRETFMTTSQVMMGYQNQADFPCEINGTVNHSWCRRGATGWRSPWLRLI